MHACTSSLTPTHGYTLERIFLKLVQQNHSTIYISRSLSTCFTRVPLFHPLMLSRSKQDKGGHTLSAHGWSQIRPDHLDRGRGVGALFTLSSAAREETNGCPRVPIGGRAVLSERAPAREGLRPLLPPCGIVAKMRPPDAVFATCQRPSGIYSFETCLALLPQLPSCGSFSTSVRCSKAT